MHIGTMKEQDILHELVSKYEQNRDYYLTPRFNETMLRSEFLDPLFELLGWDIKNSAGKRTNVREVLLEEPLKNDASTHAKKPDYTFRLFGERKFFVEAKKPCVRIEVEDDPEKITSRNRVQKHMVFKDFSRNSFPRNLRLRSISGIFSTSDMVPIGKFHR